MDESNQGTQRIVGRGKTCYHILMSQNRYKVLALALICAWGLHALHIPAAYAEPFVVPQGMDTFIADIVTRIIFVLNLLTWIAFTLLNYLLDPLFMFDLDPATGEDGALMIMLNRIWQLSRDLVNIGFAFGLIAAAVYTVVTSDLSFLNDHAKKFVLAVILVNFSWFFPRLIIDISNITAATIYGIPSMVEENNPMPCTYVSTMNKQNFCTPHPTEANQFICECALITDVQFLLEEQQANDLRDTQGYACPLGSLMCYQEKNYNQEKDNIAGYSAILNGLIINHAKLGQLAIVPTPQAGNTLKQLLTFMVKEILILVIHVALFFPLAAMVAAFIIRIPILWLTMAFMPFYFLTFVAGDKLGEIGGMLKKIMDVFLKMAFLPAIVAVPLSIGFVMLNAGSQLQMLNAANDIPIRLFDGIDNLGQIIWLMICLGVIWVGVFQALKQGGPMIEGITNKIKDAGQAVGGIAVKAPLSMPIPSVGNQTPLQLIRALNPRSIERGIEAQGLTGYLNALKGRGGSPNEARDRSDLVQKIKTDQTLKGNIDVQIREVTEGRPGAADQLVRTLRQNGYSHVDTSNLSERLQQIQRDLRNRGDSGFSHFDTPNEQRQFEEGLRRSRPADPSNPPAGGGTNPPGGGANPPGGNGRPPGGQNNNPPPPGGPGGGPPPPPPGGGNP
jgi:hypothetical protein